MGFFTNLAKDVGNHVLKQAQQIQKWREEAEEMDDDKLVRFLNLASGQKKMTYMQVAKERGTIGQRDGKFYVR